MEHSTAHKRRRGLVTLVAGLGATFALIMALVAGPASAETIDVPVTNVVVTGEEGSTHAIGSTPVDAALVGRTCDVTLTVANQSSVNPGNTVAVSSGDTSVSATGVEDTADGVTVQAGSLTLGETIDVSVTLGRNQTSSLGESLTVTCEALPVAPPTNPVVTTPPYTG